MAPRNDSNSALMVFPCGENRAVRGYAPDTPRRALRAAPLKPHEMRRRSRGFYWPSTPSSSRAFHEAKATAPQPQRLTARE